jgi:hypothetical protein
MINQELKLPKWPSGKRRPILELAFTQAQLKYAVGETFLRVQDDLDWCDCGHIFDEVLGLVVFIKYDNLPTGGTIIFVDWGGSVDVKSAIDRVIAVLKPNPGEILWQADD